MKKNKIFFFDRDGILIKSKIKNKKPFPENNIKKINFYNEIKKILKISKKNDYLNIMVTNQPDISRKKIKKQTVVKINKFLKKELFLDDIIMCDHDENDNCNCRKPKIGMLIKAKKKWNGNFKKSIIVGDRWRDIECGKKANIKTIFIDYNYNEKKIKSHYTFKSIFQFSNNIEKILKQI